MQIKPKEQKAIQQAQQFLSQNNASAAKEVLLEYTRKNKPGEYAKYYLSLSLAVLGELNEALPPAVNLVKAHADNIEYLKLLGGVYHGLQQYKQAIAIFKRALNINSSDFQTLANIANSLKETHQYEEAETCYKQSLAIQPNQADVLSNYGLLMQANAKLDEAINLHKKALQLAPEHNIALYNLAYALNEKGENETSLQVYSKVIEVMPYHVRALCDIAHVFGKLKQVEKALPFLQRAMEVAPNDEHVHLNLGITHKMMENLDRAEASFNEVIRINPNNQTAKYYLAIMTRDNTISSSPDNYVQELFDGYAETFDDQLIGQLQYKTPVLIGDMVKKQTDQTQKYKILDLGCGTGLAGIYLDDLSDHMVGVDLSSKMLKKAEKREIYDELVVSGIEQYLESHDFRPDIVVSADVFVYIGDLSSIFSFVSQSIQPNGIFVFSTEDSPDCESFELRDSGRYAHNEGYIKQLAQEYKFNILENSKMVIRQEANKPIDGQIYLLTR